jgi:hypothetical protein
MSIKIANSTSGKTINKQLKQSLSTRKTMTKDKRSKDEIGGSAIQFL